ncbi:hypothetical protein HU200_002187 [Digitaria exilis]|uniref:Fe2OG dioxygenase domain-containing protein n=1 Tax=Digitaria exilis TaxID=1010633 RepID=A0A835KU90_9POAL|nr:hypothetical protein HU200_002187 [Digitaria exilis]
MGGAQRSVQELAASLSARPPEFRCSAVTPDAPPVIDLSAPGCGERVTEAAREWGLFQVVNHGVPSSVIAELQRVGRGFFSLPKEREAWHDFFFHVVAPPARVDHGVWPRCPDGYREANEAYSRHVQQLARELFEHLSLGLGLDEGAMADAFGGGDMVFLQKINFYPPCPQPELTLGVLPHTDMSTLTLLVPNEVPGLQVFRDGHWYDVKYVPDALIVHIGDQIEILSNGAYKAVLHRTTVSKEKTRMSWPVFVEPPGELVVGPHPRLVTDESPAKYKAKKYKEYQHGKINVIPL